MPREAPAAEARRRPPRRRLFASFVVFAPSRSKPLAPLPHLDLPAYEFGQERPVFLGTANDFARAPSLSRARTARLFRRDRGLWYHRGATQYLSTRSNQCQPRTSWKQAAVVACTRRSSVMGPGISRSLRFFGSTPRATGHPNPFEAGVAGQGRQDRQEEIAQIGDYHWERALSYRKPIAPQKGSPPGSVHRAALRTPASAPRDGRWAAKSDAGQRLL